jgi:hypothetical protein
MIELRRIWFPVFLCLFCASSYAQDTQDITWMLGTWKGAPTKAGKFHFNRNINIDSISGNNFSGSRSHEADDENHSRIVIAVTGSITKDEFRMQEGKVIYEKDPLHSKWFSCNCPLKNEITISHDTVLLTSAIIGCGKYCDGVSIYYKRIGRAHV